MNSVNFWLPTLVKQALGGGGSASGGGGSGAAALDIRASLLSALPFCAAAAAMVANARHARLRGERRLHTALPMAATAAAFAATPALAAASPYLALAGLSAAAAGIWAIHGPFFR